MDKLLSKLEERFTTKTFKSLKTIKGATQKAERIYKKIVKEVLDELNLNYKEVGSQTPGDFRLDDEIVLECKKTDSGMICFNDSIPTMDWYYLFIYTGTKNIPGLLLLRGNEIISIDEREDLLARKKELKEQNIKGKNKVWSTYSRINLSLNLHNLCTQRSYLSSN